MRPWRQTEQILDSDVSRAWPVSDAGLGAMTYLLEALSGLMGDKRRWRTMPSMVALFGVLVVPLGVVSIVLVIMQPLAVGAWCTLCLFTAAAMLLMIPLALDEVVAMVQFVRRRHREGVSVWHAFWYGGHLPEDTPRFEPTRPETWKPPGMLWGVTAPPPLVLSAAVGLWLMFAPAVLGSHGAHADSDHLVGALVIVIAVIATAEVARPARFLNVPLALWLLVAPWFLDGGGASARWSDQLAGAALLVFTLPLGQLRDHYGSYDPLTVWGPGMRRRGPAVSS